MSCEKRALCVISRTAETIKGVCFSLGLTLVSALDGSDFRESHADTSLNSNFKLQNTKKGNTQRIAFRIYTLRSLTLAQPSRNVTCRPQKWPLTYRHRLLLPERRRMIQIKQTPSEFGILKKWISGAWPLYIVGHDPVDSAHSVCACFLIVKTCRGTRLQKRAAASSRGCFQFVPQGTKNTAVTTVRRCVGDLKIVSSTSRMAFRFLLSEAEVRGERIHSLVVLPV